MAIKNRRTLKNYFRNGSVPSQEEFEDLIDSSLNLIDEGFDKTPDQGFQIAQLGDSGKLISFSKAELGASSLYFMNIDESNNLTIGSRLHPSILCLLEKADQEIRVGIGLDAGRADIQPDIGAIKLDIGGAVRAEGRIGVVSQYNSEERVALADGQWHSITDDLSGCQAFEVMAGAGGPKSQGRYALMNAIAMNAYHPRGILFNFLNLKRKIKCHHAYYRSRNDKLGLRWSGQGGKNSNYRLQIRSNANYGADTNGEPLKIRYYCTRLWFDEDMSRSRTSES
jgi:hypothetical protein